MLLSFYLFFLFTLTFLRTLLYLLIWSYGKRNKQAILLDSLLESLLENLLESLLDSLLASLLRYPERFYNA